jgi:hypothetical protein
MYTGSQIQGQKGTGSRNRDTVKKMYVPVAKPSRLALGCTSFNATLQSSCICRNRLFGKGYARPLFSKKGRNTERKEKKTKFKKQQTFLLDA